MLGCGCHLTTPADGGSSTTRIWLDASVHSCIALQPLMRTRCAVVRICGSSRPASESEVVMASAVGCQEAREASSLAAAEMVTA